MKSTDHEFAEAVLKVKGLSLSYGDYPVLRDVSFEAPRGGALVVMGGSGCGKSTLLKSLIGLLEPVSGTIAYGKDDFWSMGDQEREKFVRRFGILYQGGALWSSMSLLENVSLPLETFTDLSSSTIRSIARFKLSLVGLAGFEDFMPAELSGGMRKRGGLARAMALDPEILFFDEPSAGLDPISSRRLDDLILELKESLGITFLVVTHELPSIFTIADDSIFLDSESKTLLARGNPKQLRDSCDEPKVRKFLRRESENQQI